MSGTPQDLETECDVLVVGSGAGALTGAYAAAAGGLDTTVIERTALFGGTSAYSGAACWLPGSRVQSRAGAGDSTELARAYLRALLGEETADRQDVFVAYAPAVVDLLEQNPDIAFAWQAFPDYFAAPGRLDRGRSIVPVDLPAEALGELLPLVRPAVDRDRAGLGQPGTPLTAGRALIGRLLLALNGTGRTTLRTRTSLRSLVVEDGRVVGVRAESDGRTVTLRARRGVLLAAGGFERDAAMRTEEGVPGDASWSMAPSGSNTGDPIRAAVAAGAATALMDEGWFCPAAEGPDGAVSFVLGLRGGLFTDASGARFANESLPYDRMGRAMAADPAGRIPAHFVFDSREEGALPAIAVPGLDPRACLESGVWVRADTVDELAHRIGVPAAALGRTVEEFNASARSGTDQAFHRGEDPYDLFFTGPAADGVPNPCLRPLDRPPYYAARIVLGDLGTKGGLRTDTDARVLRADGSPIEGLYAAGNTAASLSGSVYPGPGIPLGTAMTFAALAVRHLSGGV
ncbi:FAD-dependent oxidoreductase [Streptomyces sp. NBC_01089]|uniref:FAD-dependent oxidoreductase n=1 Tax=Streptomyces sp. NBC_01089 TaxID=2903747 RepID=UPI003864F24D|nr:FAD-dependent oxidoreductase [Streptomyces sp. NBC_01089]